MQPGFKIMSDKAVTAVSYTTSGGSFFVGALSLSEWAAIAGIIGVAATWGLNYWVQSRRLKMEEREHQARMSLINKGDK